MFFYVTAVATLLGLALLFINGPYRMARERSTRMVEPNSFKQVALGYVSFHVDNGYFPNSASARRSDEAIVSWRMQIAPYFGMDAYHRDYHYDEPWNSPTNSAICDFKHPHYCHHRAANSSRFTNIVMPAGPGTIGEKPATLNDITDPHDQTIIVMSLQRSDILWHEPRDLSIREITRAPDNPDRILIRGQPFEGGYCAFVDSSIAWLPANIKYDTLVAMLTIAGGESVDMAW